MPPDITRKQMVEWLKDIPCPNDAFYEEDKRMVAAILAALEKPWPSVDKHFISRWQKEMELETDMEETVHPPKWQLEKMLREADVSIEEEKDEKVRQL